MSASTARVGAVVRKELAEFRRNRLIVGTAAVLPVIFLVIPTVSILTVKMSRRRNQQNGARTGRLDNLQLSLFGSRSNRLPVLAPRPPPPEPAVVAWVSSGFDCESSELSFVLASVCACAGLGVALPLDPLWDFAFVDFLAASLAALAAASICSFALFKVEDSPK